MAQDMVKIAKSEYEELLSIKSSFNEIGLLFAKPIQRTSTKALSWDDLPSEDVKLYKPSFVRKLKKSLREAADSKGRIVTSASDL